MVIRGTLSEGYGEQALAEFYPRQYQALAQQLNIPFSRLPSEAKFRRLCEQGDFQRLTQGCNQWAMASLTINSGE